MTLSQCLVKEDDASSWMYVTQVKSSIRVAGMRWCAEDDNTDET